MTIHNPDPSEFSRMTSSVGSIRVIEYLITSATYGEIPPPIVNAVTACHSSNCPSLFITSPGRKSWVHLTRAISTERGVKIEPVFDPTL